MTTGNKKKQTSINVVFGSIALGILVVATYLTFSHHPLADIVSKWQSGIIGKNEYFPALTIFLLTIPTLLVLMVAKLLLVKWKQTKKQVYNRPH